MDTEQQLVIIARISVFAAVTSIVVDIIVGLAIWRITSSQSRISAAMVSVSQTLEKIADTQQTISDTQRDMTKAQQAIMLQVAVLDAKASSNPNAFGADGQR